MTVEKFQELYQLSNMETDEVSKSILLVQCYSGLDEEQILKMSPKRFNKLCKTITDEFAVMQKNWNDDIPTALIKANGKYYHLNYDITKKPHNAGSYVEIATFSNDIVGNLHKILATMATPMKWKWFGLRPYEREHPEIAEDMLHVDFKVAYQSAVFFYAVFSELMLNLNTSIQKEIPEEKKTKFLKVWMDFINTLGGSIQPRWFRNLRTYQLKKYGISQPDNF